MVSKDKRKHRLPTGHTLSEIVRLLHKKENQKIRSKDLQMKIGISKPVFSVHMKKLEREGTIIWIKEGREKYYMLSKNMYKILERRIDVLASNYNLFTNNELAFLDYSDADKFYSELGNKINAMMVFSILKSIETGENWTDAIDIKEFIISYVRWIVESTHPDKLPEELSESINHLDFKKINKISNKIMKHQIASDLKPLYKSLHKMYPTEFEIMNFSVEKPQINWQKHYEEIKTK
jgi:Ca2+-binding EF-hand superfamily protein